ncbi:MAG: M4 family metallopeptidase [Bacteroidetes bacterium]|nr:M4 family metallopeptidase [Bacteroidota bacterium]
MKKSYYSIQPHSCLLIALFSILFSAYGYAQSSSKALNPPTSNISLSAVIPSYVSFKEGVKPPIEGFDKWLRQKYGLAVGFGLLQTVADKDGMGFTHFRFTQTFLNIPIAGTMLIAHVKQGLVESFNGETVVSVPSEVKSRLSEAVLLKSALKFVGAKSYKWEHPEEEAFIQREQGKKASFFPKSELMYAKDAAGQYKLAYRFDIYSQEPLSRKFVLVDAETGEVLSSEDQIQDVNATGTAFTAYSGTQPITADAFNGSYRLRETGRGLGVETYNMAGGYNYAAAVDFTDADNIWNNINAAKDQCATDAHFGAEKTYDYYFNTFQRNSINNAGFKLFNYVHADLTHLSHLNNINAFWDGNRMTYGDGGNGYAPLTALDIVGHEITHGLTSFTAKLSNSSRESGALNEGFSDIFGTTIEFYATPSKADWTIAEDVGTPFRSLSNPKTYFQPDTYLGTYWKNDSLDSFGAHTNLGVLNHWYYLLCQGGNGTNDKGSVYSVSGIGMEKAANIAFRTLTVYLTSNSKYADARFYSVLSAEDLYGVCSPEAAATVAAWYAVGVGGPNEGNNPTISYNGWLTVFCSNSSFTLNANTNYNYQWKLNGVNIFGATGSSYAATQAGNYSVSTNVCGNIFTSASTALTVTSAQVGISSPATSSCTSVLLSSSSSPGYNLQWNKNGLPVNGATSPTYLATQSGSYTAVISGNTIPPTSFHNAAPVNIIERNCNHTVDTIIASGMPTAIDPSQITITVNITHPADGELIMYLESPAGEKIGLTLLSGGSGANFTNTIFSDAGTDSIGTSGAPYTGVYKTRPTTFTICAITMDKTSFAKLGNGVINPNGQWKLHIIDAVQNNLGTLNNWQVNFPAIRTPNPDCGPVTSNPINITISNSFSPTITPTGSTTLCQGGAVYLTASSGTSYLWSTGATTASIPVYSSGNYSVTVNNGVGCSGTASQLVTVVQPPVPSVISAGGPTSFCDGGSVFISGNSNGGIWSVGGSNTATLLVASAGDYFVTNSNSCGSVASNHIAVIVNPIPVVDAGSYPTVLSTAPAFPLTGTPAGGTFSGTGVVGGNAFDPTVSGAGSFPISYSYTNGNGCSNAAQTVITVTGGCNFTVGSVTGPTNACPYMGATGGLAVYSVAANNASGYVWTIPTGSTLFTGQGTNTISFKYPSSFVSGSVKVDVSSTCGAPVQQSLAITKSVPALPSPISGPTNACSYRGTLNEAIYSIAPVEGAISYKWNIPANVNLISGQGTTSIHVTFNAAFTTSTLYVQAMSGCGNSSIRTLSVGTALPGSLSTISGITKACPGDVINYSVPLLANTTSYSWTAPVGASITSGQGSNLVQVTYGVGFVANSPLAVKAVNDCGSGATRTVTISRSRPAVPSAITGNAAGNCNVTAAYSVTAVNGMTYNWIAPVGTSVTNGQGTNSMLLDLSAAFVSGTLYVNASNGCGTSANRSLALSSKPATPGLITAAASPMCIGSTQLFSIAPVNGTIAYSWKVPAGSVIQSGLGTTAVSVLIGNSSGNVTVQGYNGCGVSSTRTLPITVTSCAMKTDEENSNAESGAEVVADAGLISGIEIANKEKFSIIVMPNPFVSNATLLMNAEVEASARISIWDLTGKMIQSLETRLSVGKNFMPLTNQLASGTYFLTVTSGPYSKQLKLIVLEN